MSIGWFVFVLILVIFIQSRIFRKRGLKNIEYHRFFSRNSCVEGETIEMIDEVINRKLLPIPWLRIESRLSEHLKFQNEQYPDHVIHHGGFHRTLFSLMPYQKIRRRHLLTCTKRGHYRLQDVQMTTGDLIGFDETFERVESKAEIIVYPKLVPLEDIPLPSHSWLGDLVVRRWIIEDPFLSSGVREYQAGDPLHSIHWKATARTNELQVMKKEYTADHYLMIYINFNQTGDIWMPIVDEGLIEQSISYAATIAQYAIRKGIPVGIGCNSYISEDRRESIRIQPESGKYHLAHLFETLAKVKVTSHQSIDSFLREDVQLKVRGVDFLVITSIVTDSMRQQMDQLEALGNAVEVLPLDSEEVTKKAVEG